MAIRQPLPVREPIERPLTVDDWFSMPDDGNQYELFQGVLVLMTPPARRHQDIVGELYAAFRDLVRVTGGCVGFAPLGVALAEHLGLLPDIAYVTPGRESILSDRGIEGAPDIVVEVLSPSTEGFDRNAKLTAYFAAGVAEVWLVDSKRGVTTVAERSGRRRDAVFGAFIPSAIADVGEGGLTIFLADGSTGA